jgi:hypothetical protein
MGWTLTRVAYGHRVLPGRADRLWEQASTGRGVVWFEVGTAQSA